MTLIILPASFHFQDPVKRNKLILFTLISFELLILSGFISVFTPFRLAKFISDGFQVLPNSRPQHFAGNLFGVQTFLPIGFMNTHLTFGGLVSLFFPGITLYFMINFTKSSLVKKITLCLFFLIAVFVFFYNQSRSAWIGCIFSIFLGILKYKTELFHFLSKYKLQFFFGLLFFSLISVFSSSILLEKNWLLKRAFKESTEENTTENQRYFIHKVNFEIINKNFIFGVGPGNFSKTHWDESKNLIKKNESLWYELFITPRGHAHHDLLHFQIIGGVVSSILFLSFWISLLYHFFEEIDSYKTSLLLGIFSIFPAGFFQCYFQDDEVVFPFFALVGFFLSVNSSQTLTLKFHKKNFILASILIIILLLVSISFLYFSTRKDSSSVYKRKIKTETIREIPKIRKLLDKNSEYQIMGKDEALTGFTIEGCLTHKFTEPITPRTNEFSITLEYPKDDQIHLGFVKISAFERDAFDQDQMYKVHQTKFLKEFRFRLKKGRNTVFLNGLLSKEQSKNFPENIFFRDFKFQFEGFKSNEVLLPKILFGKDCSGE